MLRFIVGLDLSLSATGVVVLAHQGVNSTISLRLLASYVCSAPAPDGTETDKGLRLYELTQKIADGISKHVPYESCSDIHVYAEGYSFGSRNARERIGETHGAVFAGIWADFERPVSYVTPATAKRVACPDHYGWSKANWEAARKTGKWKRSMPSKEEVMLGVYRRFGLRLATDAEADAFCVAYSGMMKNPWFKPGVLISDDRKF